MPPTAIEMSFCKLFSFHIFVAALAAVLYYYRPSIFTDLAIFQPLQKDATQDAGGTKLFTAAELAEYGSNVNEEEIYLSILGSVYDVSKGKKHYGKGCSYGFFTGKDASVSFVTGEFDVFNSDSDDVAALEPADILGLFKWKKFYDETYSFKGKLIGRFYNGSGSPTAYYSKVQALAEVAEHQKEQNKLAKEQFPSCNIEWSAETGTRVWCTVDSGGIRRSWAGVPRKYFEPGAKSFRCACIRPEDLTSSNLQRYEACDENASECYYRVD